jgi:hypothetical protein
MRKVRKVSSSFFIESPYVRTVSLDPYDNRDNQNWSSNQTNMDGTPFGRSLDTFYGIVDVGNVVVVVVVVVVAIVAVGVVVVVNATLKTYVES